MKRKLKQLPMTHLVKRCPKNVVIFNENYSVGRRKKEAKSVFTCKVATFTLIAKQM